jgi:hypothetical protein
MTLTARILFEGVITAILLGLPIPTAAQQIPALAALAATLTTSNPELAGRRVALMQERTILHDKINGLNAKCAAVAKGSALAASCLKNQAELLSALNSHIRQSNNFNAAAQAAIVASTSPALVPTSSPANVKFCAAKLKVSADERAIQQMNFGNDERSFEMFENVSKAQKTKFEGKALGALLDQGIEATKIAANSARSLNPWNVNTKINELRAMGLNNDMIFTGLRKLAATEDKPAMAEAYKDLVGLVQSAKEGYDTGKDMAKEPQNATLRLLLGVLKVAQGNPELGIAVTAADFGESFAYLGYMSVEVGDLAQVTDDKLVLLKSRIERLKADVVSLKAAKQDWTTTNAEQGEPDCHI